MPGPVEYHVLILEDLWSRIVAFTGFRSHAWHAAALTTHGLLTNGCGIKPLADSVPLLAIGRGKAIEELGCGQPNVNHGGFGGPIRRHGCRWVNGDNG